MANLNRRRWQWWLLLLLLAALQAGCWDRREIEERGTVLAAGVDLCTSGEEECSLVATRQVAIPGRIPLGSASGSTGAGDSVFILRSPGRDVSDTVRRAQSMLNHKINFGHLRVTVWSEDYARQGLDKYIDYLRRHPDMRRLMWIAIAEGRAEDLMKAKPPLERVPSLYLNDMLDDAARTGRLPQLFFGNFLVSLSNGGEEATAPLIRLAGPNRPQLAGIAVFRGSKMVGKLTPEETVTYMEMCGLPRGGELLRIELPGGKRADLHVFGRQARHHFSGGPGRIYTHTSIKLETDLVQLSPSLDSSDPRVLDLIQKRAEAEVTRRAQALMAKLQKDYGADIVGLGERIRGSMPRTWIAIHDWPTAFANARCQFEVKINLRRTGMGTK